MKIYSDKVRLLVKGNIGCIKPTPALEPFCEPVLRFFNELSSNILKDASYKQYPDVTAFAFFIRKSNLAKMRAELLKDNHLRLGRGTAFHIAPSNVPINFAYSLAAGLLCGNINIVKVSSKDFLQTRLLCRAISALLEKKEHSSLSAYIAVVQYDNQKEINDYFSSVCHTRIIWGGDGTIAEIRKSPIPPRSLDITFANRYSFCLINAQSYLDFEDKEKLAADFYNDTYNFDQNACFSPRLVYWAGEKSAAAEARGIFWEKLHNYAKAIYSMEDGHVTEKQMAVYRTILAGTGGIQVVKMPDNLVVRCEADGLNADILENSGANGFFMEYTAPNLDGLDIMSSVKIQTLSCFGYSTKELAEHIAKRGLTGVDRITEIGKSHEFSFVWDGINLITALTRIIHY